MRWRGERESGNIEDRRGQRVGRRAGIGGVGGVVLGLLALYFTNDPSMLLQSIGGLVEPQMEQRQGPYQESAAEADSRKLVAVTLADTENVWNKLFAQAGKRYEEPRLVLFSGQVRSACGLAKAATGPFYCPGDHKVYIDLSFYDELSRRFGAPGDFARAYVIAHEVGHHVQNLLGTSDQVQQAYRAGDERRANALSVRLELQADCYAGVWANHTNKTRQMLEKGDIEAGLNAASAIGDDRLQKQGSGQVNPDSFTHGTSAQRVRWFKRGIETGDARQCDTFAAKSL
jgi:predicted metalloprotease